MIKFIKDITLTILLTFILFVFLTNSSLVINAVNQGISVFVKNVLPSLMPFFILTDILLNYKYFDNLKHIFKFKYVNFLIVSMISGLPSNAKYLSYMIKNNSISISDASRVLAFSFFPNPMFIIGTVGVLLNNKVYPIIVLGILYLSSFIVYLINYKSLENKDFVSDKSKVEFFNLLKSSIQNSFSALLVILGIIVVFTIIINIVKEYLRINQLTLTIINIILELTTGVKSISILNIPLVYKYTLLAFGISMSGISVIMQAFGIMSGYKLNYKIFIKSLFNRSEHAFFVAAGWEHLFRSRHRTCFRASQGVAPGLSCIERCEHAWRLWRRSVGASGRASPRCWRWLRVVGGFPLFKASCEPNYTKYAFYVNKYIF